MGRPFTVNEAELDWTEASHGKDSAQRTVDAFFRSGDRVEYYEGEE